ncbi:MAG: TnsA endonuclease N-terminal domain-containing protein [Thermodesulfovibrionales bacterium]|jgi:putative transposase
MLDKKAFEEWVKKNKITDEGLKVIEQVRSSRPHHAVRGTLHLSGFYFSSKMGFAIQYDSALELSLIKMLEFNPRVLEFYQQPYPFTLSLVDQSGRSSVYRYTADFFVIWETEAGWTECKDEERLRTLSLRYPNRYLRKNRGNWVCTPCTDFATKLGLSFTVFSSRQLHHWKI